MRGKPDQATGGWPSAGSPHVVLTSPWKHQKSTAFFMERSEGQGGEEGEEEPCGAAQDAQQSSDKKHSLRSPAPSLLPLLALLHTVY